MVKENHRIIIHYDEIGLKGKNRPFYENTLKENIKRAIGDSIRSVYRRFGRIVCVASKNTNVNKLKVVK